MTGKIFGLPLILILLVLFIVVPLGLGEIQIIRSQEALEKQMRYCISGDGPLIAQPTEEPTPTTEEIPATVTPSRSIIRSTGATGVTTPTDISTILPQ